MIHSLSNKQIQRVCAYQKKRKERDRDGVFVAEGERLVTEAPADRIVALYVSASYHKVYPPDAERFFARAEDRLQVVSDEVFAKMSDTKTPQGVLAVVKRDQKNGAGAGQQAHVLVLDGIQDPGNLGTILRSTEATGAGGIYLCGETADVYQPKVVRASMGSIFRVPVWQGADLCDADAARDADASLKRTGNTACGTGHVLRCLKKQGYTVAAADMNGTVDYDAYDWRKKTALVVGNEANGLSDEAKREADVLLRIPMTGKNESLNAAVAASVLLFEALRQTRVRL